MRNTLFTIAAAALTIATMTTARADEFDKKTNITVNETILIPGRTLPPGKYVMKLANVTANRHVVQIFNEDQTKLEATILAFNNYRLEPTDKTTLSYWETPAGSPPALRSWFFPGDNFGQEFAYPKAMAEKLSAENHTRVASYDTTAALSTESAANLQVRDTPPDQAAGSTPAPAPQQVTQASPRREETAAPAPVAAAQPAQPTLLAQNNPPPASPAPFAQPEHNNQPTELPQTASPMPWVVAAAGLSLIAAAALKLAVRA